MTFFSVSNLNFLKYVFEWNSAGGPILQLEWDRNSERLAVTIDGDSPGMNQIVKRIKQQTKAINNTNTNTTQIQTQTQT